MTNVGGEFYFSTKTQEGSRKITTDKNMTITAFTENQRNDAGLVETKDGKQAEATRVTDDGKVQVKRKEFAIGDSNGSSIFNEITKLDGNGDNLTTDDLAKVTQGWLKSKFGNAVKLVKQFNAKDGIVEIAYTTSSGNRKHISINAQMDSEDDQVQAKQVNDANNARAEEVANRSQADIQEKIQEKFGNKYAVSVETLQNNPYEAPKKAYVTLNQDTTLGEIRTDFGLPEKEIVKANPQLNFKKMSGVSDFEVNWLHKDRNYDNIKLAKNMTIAIPFEKINI